MAYFVDTRLELTAAIVAWLVKTVRWGGGEWIGQRGVAANLCRYRLVPRPVGDRLGQRFILFLWLSCLQEKQINSYYTCGWVYGLTD